MTFVHFRHISKWLITGFLIGALLSLVASTAPAHENVSSSRSDNNPYPDSDPLWKDAEQLADDVGISVEEAKMAAERQPRVGRLQRALEERGPASFGGLFIEYTPEYRIVLLAPTGGADEVFQAIDHLGFGDLSPFAIARETAYTQVVLEEALGRVKKIGGTKVTTIDLDIRTGEILATAASAADVEAVRAAVNGAQLPITARRVIVHEGGEKEQHSYGGLGINYPSAGDCTAGFTVRRTTDDAEGVADAGHCANEGASMGHHSGINFDHMNEKNRDSQDVQWFRTPGLDDLKQFKDDHAGNTRSVTSRTDRSDMVIGGLACHYGRASGYGCGQIAGKNHDPDGGGNKFNSTFIRVENDDTMNEDSGGPWFVGNSAYGIHKGSTFGGAGVPEYPFFMAQNFMEALNIQVQISP